MIAFYPLRLLCKLLSNLLSSAFGKSFDRSEYQLQIDGISYENSTEYLCLSQVLENVYSLSHVSQARLTLVLVLILKWDAWNNNFWQIAPRIPKGMPSQGLPISSKSCRRSLNVNYLRLTRSDIFVA